MVDIDREAFPELQWQGVDSSLVWTLAIESDSDMLYPVLTKDTSCLDPRVSGVYYYHSDHLGSAAWVTHGAQAVQFVHYMPFGEMWYNQQGSAYNERYKFTGKERDAETGYDYFGARYYASGNLSWLSVDPLADKYPQISPYAYCNWNPVKNIDPDGRELISSFNLNPNIRINPDYKRNSHIDNYAKNYYDNNSPVIHFFAHGTPNRIRLKDGTAINTPQKMYNYLNEQSQEFKASCSTGKPSVLVLHSCSTGSGENSFAQQLSADELFSNTLVIAPSSVLEVGSKETISNAGSWIAFYNGKQVGTINAHDTPWYKFWGEKKEAVQLNDLFKNMTPEQIFKFFNVDLDK